MGRTSWEGGQRELEALISINPSVPPLRLVVPAKISHPTRRRRARYHLGGTSDFPLATFPSLFNPLSLHTTDDIFIGHVYAND